MKKNSKSKKAASSTSKETAPKKAQPKFSDDEIQKIISDSKKLEKKTVISESIGVNTFIGITSLSVNTNDYYYELISHEKKLKHYISLKDRSKFRFIVQKDQLKDILKRYKNSDKKKNAEKEKWEVPSDGLSTLLADIKELSKQTLTSFEKIGYKKKIENFHLEVSMIEKCDIADVKGLLKDNYQFSL
ncbi:hypothetical protein N9N67_07360 [Bacteriovoracaceae bacterium]|nr:hypothetical protein [Bacteriovoracaceae bacterium]